MGLLCEMGEIDVGHYIQEPDLCGPTRKFRSESISGVVKISLIPSITREGVVVLTV